jgi:hypothetical protein
MTKCLILMKVRLFLILSGPNGNMNSLFWIGLRIKASEHQLFFVLFHEIGKQISEYLNDIKQ